MVQYDYDAWGNHTVTDTSGIDLGTKNPFRYRSYFYDTETGLYFLKTRYYDPTTCRFISQDSFAYADPETVNGLNLYAYCGNNPVINIDPTGEFAISGLIIAALIGAGIGAASYVVSEVVSYAFTGEWSWSWGMFLGSILGGAIGGALSFLGVGITTSAFFTGLLSTSIGMGLENAFGEADNSVGEIIWNSFASAAFSAAFAGLTKQIRILGITGRGSISQVARQMNTKLLKGIIRGVSAKTFMKMAAYSGFYSIFNTLYSGISDALQYFIKKYT